MAEEIKPAEVIEIPKGKEGWDKLRADNPQKWAELTQDRMDQNFREKKELEDKLRAKEESEKNLLAELNQYKQPKPVVNTNEPVQYGNGVYPQTEEQWNDLFLERPTFANDLRNVYLNERNTVVSDFNQNRENGAKLVQSEHPEMYVVEMDSDGTQKKDKDGKLILRLDPTTNKPIFNKDSEKGKLWDQIFNEDPQGWNSLKNAPSLMMAEMERRLRSKGADMVKGQNNEVNDETGVAPRGVPPPKTSSLKFASAEEEALAKKAVDRGTYKNLEEYVKYRDNPTKGYAEANSRPVFK